MIELIFGMNLLKLEFLSTLIWGGHGRSMLNGFEILAVFLLDWFIEGDVEDETKL